MNPFYRVDSVFLDCDSTLTAIEGIDELARRHHVHAELAALTRAAMAGELPLEQVYQRRLDVIQPDQSDIDWLGDSYVQNLVPDAAEVIRRLQLSGKQLHIISGGIRQAVLRLAGAVNIADTNVHAVDLYLDDTGQYAGYDTASPLCRTGGKATVCRELIADGRRAVLVGDGMTDLEAGHERVHVIGFGGVVCRENVRAAAPDFISTLSSLLPRVLTMEEMSVGSRQ